MKKVGMTPDNAARPPILTADEQLAGLMEIIRQQSQTIEELRNTISELNASLAWLKKKVFGKMSEKCKPINGDPMLPFEDGGLMQIEAEIEEARKKAEEQILVPRPQAAVTTRRNRIVMDDLPVVTVIINPEGIDLDDYVKIGEEHTRTLEMKPGYLYVKDTVRPTYALKDSRDAEERGEKTVVTAPLPLMPIYKGMPGASMLAEVLLQKYEYHVPFYRQVRQLEHLGVKLSKNTLDGWFKPVCELLRPLYLEIKKKILSSDVIVRGIASIDPGASSLGLIHTK
ncbi:IS66 family transposase [Dysgonomonas termitidis]